MARALLLHRSGMNAMHFGKIDEKTFLIPPFALLYFSPCLPLLSIGLL